MTANSHPVWARDGVVLLAEGPSRRVDPGTGPGRYTRAMEALAESGRRVGLASFTFDPDEPGSVVVLPETTRRIRADELDTVDHVRIPHVKTEDDGVNDWAHAFVGASEAIASEVAEKVVLTRQVEVSLDSEPSLDSLFANLLATEKNSLVFAVDRLVGASPELLASVVDGDVSSLALAGTASEASSLGSEKMAREHELSRSSVVDGLAGLVTDLEVHETSVREFGSIKHLATRFEARANVGIGVLDLVASLHPTAAVAGTPTDTSLKLIKNLEKRSRNRYAGPVGWFDADGQGEFAIALRCGLFDGLRATLYAGGGIIKGSERALELAETELKLRPMLGALSPTG